MSDLLESTENSTWCDIKKDGNTIGRINVESNFFENSSSSSEESVAVNRKCVRSNDLNLIDDQKLLSKPYWTKHQDKLQYISCEDSQRLLSRKIQKLVTSPRARTSMLNNSARLPIISII